ncbi:LamG domain-containing protein [Paraburkholderia sp. Tr-20389]|uniref:LamG domain-containing protein n=1 Tax=Paraburkholderia sp. Tr-20389 TaxID=2703903 RepID=UPI00197E7BC9|nr:LamG domain-containing protein [Paraburkholderia sp. Tr-20389]MBN3757992.1 LamG domain-containing protein [Paraburkholderia sp. Tr-20389]
MTGISHNALSLSGGGYLSIAPITLSGDFSVDAWVNTLNPPTNQDGVFHTAEGYDFNFYAGYPRFWGDSRDVLISSAAVRKGLWTHVALTRSSGAMSIYVNGVKTAEGTFNGALNIDSIGRTVAGTYTGALDEVHVYNRALSASEIANLMQTSVPGVGGTATPGEGAGA